MPKLTPFLWFNCEAEEAATFYASVFPNSKVHKVVRMPNGAVLTVEFELDGKRFVALNGGPQYKFSEAISFVIDCSGQAEVDRYWNALTADGGAESMCGWLKDKYGVSWQVVPDQLVALMNDPDPGRAGRAVQAMMQMRKIVIADLEAAAAAG